MSEPLIDILMATYNGERFVGEQIESIQAQTYGNWRLLVSDDCSSDGTLDVVCRYAAEDERIRIVSEDVRYGGAKENFFALMSKTDAPYAMFCDQDDVWLPEKIEKSLTAVALKELEIGDNFPVALYTDMTVVDAGLCTLADSFLDQERKKYLNGDLHGFLSISGAAGCTMLFNRTLVDVVGCGNFSAALMHDWWLAIVASSCGALIYFDEPTVLYRQHGDNELGADSYSFWKRACNFAESRNKYWLSCEQARDIAKRYGAYMRPASSALVSAYASQLEYGFFKSLGNLQRHRLLKKGTGRAVAQILTLLMGSTRSRE